MNWWFLENDFSDFVCISMYNVKEKKNYPVEKVTKKFIAVLWKELS